MEKQKQHKRFFGIFNHLSRSKTSLPTTASVAGASGTAAAFSKSENSAATSKNLQAASVRLNDYLVLADGDEDRTQDVVSMSRWVEKTEMYTNASLADREFDKVSLGSFQRDLINLAAVSSKEVYGRESTQSSTHGRFVPGEPTLHLHADALVGSVKATTVRYFRSSSQAPYAPATIVVVSIRGTASIHDWMVNFNDEGDIATSHDFLVGIDRYGCWTSALRGRRAQGINPGGSPYKVHKGFLECAKTIALKLAHRILEIVLKLPLQESGRAPQLLFTGHSAGGAVAALLYAHISGALDIPGEFIRLKSKFSEVHCITFGAPPVSQPRLPRNSSASTFLSVINEGDPIPRIDKEYLNSLLKLYVSPMPKAAQTWELPKMELCNAGEIILLPKRRRSLAAEYEDGPPFFLLPENGEGSLENTVMGDPRVHMMNEYLRKLRIAA